MILKKYFFVNCVSFTNDCMDIVNQEKVKNYIIKLRADIIINPTDNMLLCCRIDLNL